MSLIKKGTIINFTCGSYSDYHIRLTSITLVDFDIMEVRDEYFAKFPDQREAYSADYSKFTGWMTNEKKLVADFDITEVYLGDYGSIEPEII